MFRERGDVCTSADAVRAGCRCRWLRLKAHCLHQRAGFNWPGCVPCSPQVSLTPGAQYYITVQASNDAGALPCHSPLYSPIAELLTCASARCSAAWPSAAAAAAAAAAEAAAALLWVPLTDHHICPASSHSRPLQARCWARCCPRSRLWRTPARPSCPMDPASTRARTLATKPRR